MALRNVGGIALRSTPRMADFARWVTAAEPALHWPEGVFLEAYRRNHAAATDRVIEDDPVALLLLEVSAEQPRWEGTASELLSKMDERRYLRNLRLPPTPSQLGSQLRRLVPTLQKLGLRLELDKRRGKDGTRVIAWDRVENGVSDVSAVSREEP